NCESDFVARTEDFKELVHDIAMHIAASDPKFIRKEDVTPEAYEKEKDIYRAQAKATGKPDNVVEKIVEGKMAKFYEEVCLYEQPFIKDQAITVSQLIASKIGKLGENISVRRVARFKVGDANWTIAQTKASESAPSSRNSRHRSLSGAVCLLIGVTIPGEARLMFGSFRVPALIPPQEGTMKRLLAVI